MDWGKQPTASNTANMAVSSLAAPLDTAPDGVHNLRLRRGANRSNLSGAVSNNASFRNRM